MNIETLEKEIEKLDSIENFNDKIVKTKQIREKIVQQKKKLEDLTNKMIKNEIVAVKKQLFQLRLQKATRQLEKPHQFKHARHRLSQLLTVEGERKRAASLSDQEQK